MGLAVLWLLIAFCALAAAACGQTPEKTAVSSTDPVLAFHRDGETWGLARDWTPRHLTTGVLQGWSSDGGTILVHGKILVNRYLRLSLYELESRRKRLRWTADSGGGVELEAEWSPAHDQIAVLSPSPDGFGTILAVMNARRGRPVKIAGADRDGDPLAFAWSPDGRRLAYVACYLVGPGSHGELHCQLNATDLRTRRKQVLLKNFSWAEIAWSPDGTAIAVDTQRRRSDNEGDWVEGSNGLYVLELATAQLTQVVTGRISTFAWRPDSLALAYILSDDDFDPKRRPDTIQIVDRAGEVRSVLSTATDEEYGGDLAWSPDLDLIAVYAYAVSGDFKRLGLRVIDPATGKVVHRTSGDDSDPIWRPRTG